MGVIVIRTAGVMPPKPQTVRKDAPFRDAITLLKNGKKAVCLHPAGRTLVSVVACLHTAARAQGVKIRTQRSKDGVWAELAPTERRGKWTTKRKAELSKASRSSKRVPGQA